MDLSDLYEAKLKEARELVEADEPTAEDLAKAETLEAEAADIAAKIERAKKAKAAKARIDAGLDALTETTSRETLNVRPALDAPAREAVLDDPRAGFKSFAEFAKDVWQAGPNEMAQSERLRIHAASGMSQTIGHDGGFLVPPTFSTQIWDGMRTSIDNLWMETDQYTVEGESLTIPANAETSRAAGSRYGGIRAYWLGEADQITSSAPTFRQMKLEPQELAVLVYVTDKLLRNSPVALEQYLTKAATEEINFYVNDAIVNGSGVGKPLGILNAACLVSVTKETGQAADTIVKENLDKMWARLHARSWANAKWYINQDCLPQLQNLSQTVGVGGMPVFLPPGGMSAAPYGTLYGRPVVPIEYAQTLGDNGDIILADLSAYAFGLKGGVGQAMSIHLKFDYMETAFRWNFACDGQPWLASAITPFNSTDTLSPFVALAERA